MIFDTIRAVRTVDFQIYVYSIALLRINKNFCAARFEIVKKYFNMGWEKLRHVCSKLQLDMATKIIYFKNTIKYIPSR